MHSGTQRGNAIAVRINLVGTLIFRSRRDNTETIVETSQALISTFADRREAREIASNII